MKTEPSAANADAPGKDKLWQKDFLHERGAPMIGEMRQLLERPTGAVMCVVECQKAMDAATKKFSLAHLIHHDLRHLFAILDIENGVDIPAVSRWLGHKDGGALATKVYGHLRNQHSASMARLVNFALSNPNVVPLPNPEQQNE